MATHGISAQEAFKVDALTNITDAVRQHTTSENCWIEEMATWARVADRLGATPLEVAAAFVSGLMETQAKAGVVTEPAEHNV